MVYILLFMIAQISRRRVTPHAPLNSERQFEMDFTIPEDLRMMQETIKRFVKKDLESVSRPMQGSWASNRKILKKR